MKSNQIIPKSIRNQSKSNRNQTEIKPNPIKIMLRSKQNPTKIFLKSKEIVGDRMKYKKIKPNQTKSI